MNTNGSSTAVEDPVCGMTVNPATAKAQFQHAGSTYYFCCAGCARKFQAAPEQYIKPKAAGLVTVGGGPTVRPSPALVDISHVSHQRGSRAFDTCTRSRSLLKRWKRATRFGDRLCLSYVPRGAGDEARPLSHVRDGAGARDSSAQDRIHLSHASGGRSVRARK